MGLSMRNEDASRIMGNGEAIKPNVLVWFHESETLNVNADHGGPISEPGFLGLEGQRSRI